MCSIFTVWIVSTDKIPFCGRRRPVSIRPDFPHQLQKQVTDALCQLAGLADADIGMAVDLVDILQMRAVAMEYGAYTHTP